MFATPFRLVSVLLLPLMFVGTLGAQFTTELLTGAPESLPPVATNGEHSGFPINTYWHDQRLQAVYLRNDLIAAGLGPNSQILSLSLRCAELPGRPVANFRIRMAHTSDSAVATLSASGLVTHFGPATLPVSSFSVNSWRTFTLSTPFIWNGADNVFIDFTTDDTGWTNGGACYVRNVGLNRCRYGYADSTSNYPFDNIAKQSGAAMVPSLRLTYAVGVLAIVTQSPLPNAAIGQAHQQDIQAVAGTAPYTWTLTGGTIPPGMTLTQQGTVYRLAGTPPSSAANQVYSFTVRVQDSATPPTGVQRTFQITVDSVVIGGPANLPSPREASFYSQVFTAANGSLPYAWSLVSGTLPSGLTLGAVGNDFVLEGTPDAGTGAQSYAFTIRVIEDGGQSAQLACSLFVIGPPAPLPFADDFSTDKGWTLGSEPGSGTPPSATWQRAPCGAAYIPPYGQPEATTDHSPGTDNYILGDNIGAIYPNSMTATAWAVSPAFDCTGIGDVELTFWRQLNVEEPQYDRAYIEVSVNDGATWTRIWQNSVVIEEGAWGQQKLNISQLAGNQPNVRVRFGIGPTDQSWQYSGWCIDDFEVRELPSSTKLVLTDFKINSPYTLGSQMDPRVYTGTVTPIELIVDNATANAITVDSFSVEVTDFTTGGQESIGTFTPATPAPFIVPASATQFVIAGTLDCTQLASSGPNVTLRARARLQGTEDITGKPVETELDERFYVDQGPPPPPPSLEVREHSFTGPTVDHDQPAAGTGRDLGDVDVDSGATPFNGRNIMIVNKTALPVSVGTPVLAGPDAAHFRLSTTQWTSPTMTLATNGAGSQIFFTVRFDPHDIGARSAWVEFSHDATNPATTPFRVPLAGNGTGAPPELQVHEVDYIGPKVSNAQAAVGTTRDFGPVIPGEPGVWLNIVLWNRFATATTIDHLPMLAGPDAADFELFFFAGEIQGGAGSYTIPGNTAFTEITFFAVRFKPQAATTLGPKTATVSFGHDADNPTGPTLPNSNREFTFEVAGEAVSNANPHISVYEATAAAAQSGAPTYVVLNGAAPQLGRDFGTRAPGAGATAFTTIRIINPGAQPLTIGAPALGGTNPGEFLLSTAAPWQFSTSINAGSFTEFGIAFDPTSVGQKVASVAFTHNATQQTASPFVFDITGLGQLDAPVVRVHEVNAGGPQVTYNSPAPGTARDFGSRDVNAGGSVPLVIHIGNTGTQDLVLGTPTLAGAHTAEFVLDTTGILMTIPVGMSTTFTVTFDPSTYGPKSAFVQFTHNDPLVNSPFRFEVAGFGDAPSLEVREGSTAGPILAHAAAPAGARDFGTVQVAAMPSPALTIVFVNAGNAGLDLSAPTLSGANASSFLLTAGGLPVTLAAGGSASFTLQFNAAQVGTKEATISITHSDSSQPSAFEVRVRGMAADPSGVRIETGPNLPGGRVGSSYPSFKFSASGGATPYTWSLRPNNSLPAGLTLGGDGTITGKPANPAGVFQFEVRVTDANGGTADQTFNLTINPAPGQGFGKRDGGGGACAVSGSSTTMLDLVLAAVALMCARLLARASRKCRTANSQ
jgi:hypothetical protein